MTTKMSRQNATIKSPKHKKAPMPKARAQTPKGFVPEVAKRLPSMRQK